MTNINIDTNDAMYLKCDIGYIHLREGLERPISTGQKPPKWSGGTNLRPILSENMSTHFTHLELKTDPCPSLSYSHIQVGLGQSPPPPGPMGCLSEDPPTTHSTF